jgi:hypothetical protein
MKYLLMAFAAMVTCALAATPKAYTEVSKSEARSVTGAACYTAGVATSVCSGLTCVKTGKSTGTTAVGPNPAGTLGLGTIQCQCAPQNTAPAAAGSCTKTSAITQ